MSENTDRLSMRSKGAARQRQREEVDDASVSPVRNYQNYNNMPKKFVQKHPINSVAVRSSGRSTKGGVSSRPKPQSTYRTFKSPRVAPSPNLINGTGRTIEHPSKISIQDQQRVISRGKNFYASKNGIQISHRPTSNRSPMAANAAQVQLNQSNQNLKRHRKRGSIHSANS